MKKILLITGLIFFGIISSFSQNMQISGGNGFSVALCSNSVVYGWGSNNAGQANGISTTSSPILTPVIINGLPINLKQATGGSGSHGMALDCNGSIWTWGLNNCGQLGTSAISGSGECNNGSQWRIVSSVSGIGIGQTYGPAVMVNGSTTSTYALLSTTGYVLAWGRNVDGELGINSTNNYSSVPVYVQKCSGGNLNNIVQVIAGDYTVYAVDNSGVVYSWGKNDNSNLGRTGSNSCAAAVQSDYNNDGTVDGPIQNIVSISGGDTHGMALDANGAIWTWGGAWGPGQLGNSNGGNRNFAAKVPLPNTICSSVINGGTNEGIGPFFGDIGQRKVVYISAGQASSIAVLDDGSVVTFGANQQYMGGSPSCNYGTLGQGSNSTGASVSCPNYVLTNPTTKLSNITKVSRGDGWYFAIDKNNNAFAWGVNVYGQLGNGNTTCQEYAIPITLPSGCNLAIPCANKPTIGVNTTACPSLFMSTSEVSVPNYLYNWMFTSSATLTTSTSWNTLSTGTSISNSSLSGNSFGYYKLSIVDTRGTFATSCGSCPIVSDTIKLSPPICSINPNLGTNQTVCQPISQTLNSGLVGNNLVFLWEYSTTSSNSGFTTLQTGTGLNIITVTGIGYYRVTVIDNNTCSGCIPSSSSVINLSLASSTYNGGPSSICSTIGGSGIFSITTTSGGGSYFWYTNPIGGLPLNSVAGLSLTGVDPSVTSSLLGCNGRVLYVTDQSQISGILNPGACSGPSGTSASYYLLIQPTRNISINSLQVALPGQSYSQTFNFSVNIYSNNPSGGYCSACSGNFWEQPGGVLMSSSSSKVLPSTTSGVFYPYTVSTSGLNLNANTRYWISINSSIQLGVYSNCFSQNTSSCLALPVSPCSNWPSVIWDNTGQNVIGSYGSIQYGSNWTNSTDIRNIGFSAGVVAQCSRIPVCATTVCTPLSVEFIDFRITKNKLNWVVSEENSSYYIIESSDDGVVFKSFGKVISKGNGINDYSFIDQNNKGRKMYYRIIQYDNDNSYHISKIISTEYDNILDFVLIPNPNNGKFSIELNITNEFDISIRNMVGTQIYYGKEKGSGYFIKDISINESSVYFVTISDGISSMTKKMVVY